MDIKRPVKLKSARVWRTYLGGKLIDQLHGLSDARDSNFPEEWIMSTVRARNSGRENIVEGLSEVAGDGRTLAELIAGSAGAVLGGRTEMGILKSGTRTAIYTKSKSCPPAT